MLKETIELKVDYEKAGVSSEGCKPVLDCYYSTLTEEIGRKKHRAMIICPGGGYDYCSEREAEPIAFRFIAYGISCFVLRYTCQRMFPTDALECAAAIKYVRDNAEKFDIDPDKIIVAGFSAGGHLAATVSNLWQSEILTKPLGCKPEDIKVNGSLLSYAVLTSDPEYTHEGSILNLIGEKRDPELRKFLAMEDRVSESTPPTFLWHCADDGCVRVENSLFYMTSLSKNHIPFEAHIYEHGGHGLALCDDTTATWEGHYQPVAAKWVDSAIAWVLRL
ncbi:alpha/beta hydrolase [uncultured Ruminococcus sp.]|uniref:alpha/beta hydrolase n=1 Tax=uncultured Ruminococcus sp. TaxID=165186 RepID=UPI0025CBE4C4|nr:alpha/beta hydrolase [uncultured Ruminococcus sp.]